MLESGRLIVISGASQCGKTAHAKKGVAKSKRVIAWDPEDQWSKEPGFKRLTTRAQLFEAVQRPGPARLAYVASGEDVEKEFSVWAEMAFYWGDKHGPCDVIGEELADVTDAGKARGGFGKLLRRGLKRGMNIYCLSQLWTEATKTAVGNATEYVCFAMSNYEDVVYFSRKTRIPVDQLAALRKTIEGKKITCPYIRYERASNKIEAGKHIFTRK